MVFLQDGYGISANDVLKGALHGSKKVAFLCLLREFYELHQHLGIGVGTEVIALFLQFGAERLIVLDDTIMHQREVPALAEVRMGVDGVGLAVGGPAGMGYTDAAGGVLGGTLLFQGRHFAGGLIHVKVSLVVNHAHASRVIAAIFQSMKTLYQNRVSFLLTDVSYNSAHLLLYFGGTKIICKNTKIILIDKIIYCGDKKSPTGWRG